jgi:hypothetical protein
MLFNEVANCKDYVAPATDKVTISMECQLYGNDR